MAPGRIRRPADRPPVHGRAQVPGGDADTYDAIIIDISEPVEEGPAYLLFTREFYEIVKERLSPDGDHRPSGGHYGAAPAPELHGRQQDPEAVFPVVAPYRVSSRPSDCPGASPWPRRTSIRRKFTPQELDEMIKKRIKGENRYYDGITNLGMYILPKHIRKALAERSRS